MSHEEDQQMADELTRNAAEVRTKVEARIKELKDQAHELRIEASRLQAMADQLRDTMPPLPKKPPEPERQYQPRDRSDSMDPDDPAWDKHDDPW